MPDTYTPNLNLTKPGYDRPADISVINSNMDKLDAAYKTVDALKLGGKAPEYYTQPRNLLDNSWWQNPSDIINQRGYVSGNDVGGNTYFIDRWRNPLGVTTRYEMSEQGLVILGDAGIRQDVVGVKTGTICTAAVKCGDEIVCVAMPVTYKEDGTYQELGTATNGKAKIWLSTQYGRLLVMVTRETDADSVTVKWAALYEGAYTAETLPPYVPKGYAAELAECRRYYKEFACKSDSFEITFFGYVTTDSKYIIIDAPFNMRSGGLPSVMLDGSITIRGINGYLESSSSGYSDVNVSVYGNTECEKGSICFRKKDGTVFADATNNTPVTVNMRPGSKITLSRDL